VIPVSDVLVLNADMQPLHRVSLRHAVRMLVRQVAEVHDAAPDRLIGIFPMPLAVRLVRYVYTKWRHTNGPAWSRRGVLARDGRRCGYCTKAATTVDHIVPRSQGGRNTWANTVAACYTCNQRKADRTPAQANMTLRTRPAAPTWASAVRT
jgi:5-methylcytosine-specific restriction endonuclease McrA